jgi:hypothetical protein
MDVWIDEWSERERGRKRRSQQKEEILMGVLLDDRF